MIFYFFLQNPTGSRSKIPYRGKERYDGLPWQGYATRKGLTSSNQSWAYIQHELWHPTPKLEKEAFLQTWLFFGLLSEFIGVDTDVFLGNLTLNDQPNVASPPTSSLVLDFIYDTFVTEDENVEYVSTSFDGLRKAVEKASGNMPQDLATQTLRYKGFITCLEETNRILTTLDLSFDHAIKYSIGCLAELLHQAVIHLYSQELTKSGYPRQWGQGFMTPEIRTDMIENGWCPSDITRVVTKYTSLQSLQFVRLMDRSMPKRDHSKCSDLVCVTHQIISREYVPQHRTKDCLCEELSVDISDIIHALNEEPDTSIPLLKLTGDLQILNVEVVSSRRRTPYIAVSHIWADGLGNPHDNSLHKCQLFKLKERVNDLHQSVIIESPQEVLQPLIFLDTLCFPARSDTDEQRHAKQKAISKIRLVYERAQYVLVLDNSIMAHTAATLSIPEQLLRIFTSSWMRRLWTLQEGALATSLYFQFADEAISLQQIVDTFYHSCNAGEDLRYCAIKHCLLMEKTRISAFFSGPQRGPGIDTDSMIALVDQALQYRGVTNPSDEPLCIGTLLGLNIEDIYRAGIGNAPEEETQLRMQKVWDLIWPCYGIPAQVIFFEEARIPILGWRWAPASLLGQEMGLYYRTESRCVRWQNLERGHITPHGLRVGYPGFRIKMKEYGDDFPRNPWAGSIKISSEINLTFQDEDGAWYRMAHLKLLVSQRDGLEVQKRRLDDLGPFPLRALAGTNEGYIILQLPIGHGVDETTRTGIFTRFINADSGILVKTEHHVLVSRLAPEEQIMFDGFQKLAMKLRYDDIVKKHQELNEADKAENVFALYQKMRDSCNDLLEEDIEFKNACKAAWGGGSGITNGWGILANWFEEYYFTATTMPVDQVWIVD